MPENIIWLIVQNLSPKRGFDWQYTTEEHIGSILQNKNFTRSDSTENKLNPIQFWIYYNVQFA